MHFTDFTGYALFIITSFLASVESTDQCLLKSKVLSCFSVVIMSIRSFFLFEQRRVLLICHGSLSYYTSINRSSSNFSLRSHKRIVWEQPVSSRKPTKVILTYNEVPSFEMHSDIYKSLEGI